MKSVMMLEIHQPIGEFYIGKMQAKDVINISKVSRRDGNSGHQRQLKEKRKREIAMYCQDPDATFPTPIILSVSNEDFKLKPSPIDGFICFEFDEKKKCAELLDGQHRIAGIAHADNVDFELPVIVMFDLKEEQKAYVFSTINGNQVKVDKSLIYDLFDLNETRSPQKTCHQIARALNSDANSPFYRRLKMLEKREHEYETISQSTFVTNLCELISSAPQEDAILLKRGRQLVEKNDGKSVFRKYFIKDQDSIILKILMNYFGAAASVFKTEWNAPNQYILTKTVGFSGLMAVLKYLVPEGEMRKDLSRDFFVKVFKQLKEDLKCANVKLTSDDFPSNAQSANRLAKLIIDAEKKCV